MTWRGLRLFCKSPKLATVAPWLPLTNRSYGVRRTAPHLTISTTMRVRPRVLRAKRASVTWAVTDDWPKDVPVTETEIDVFEAWFGDLFDELYPRR